MEGFALAYMGAGIGLGLAVIGAGLGIGRLAAGAAEAIARQPSATAQITGAVNLPLFLLEGVAILAEVFALLIVLAEVEDAERTLAMNNPLVQPDPGLYIWTIVTFLVLRGAAGEVRLAAAARGARERQEAIRKSLDDARQAKQELERLHAESAKILAQARAEAEAIIVVHPDRREPVPRGDEAEGARRGATASSRTPSSRSSWRPRARSSRSGTRRWTSR